jgi:hypothetical protein
MEKQKKKLGSFNAIIGKKAFPGPGNSKNEIDADELVHQTREQEHDDAAFDEDEAIHKVKRNTNIEPGSMEDIDDLMHENEEEDDEPIY